MVHAPDTAEHTPIPIARGSVRVNINDADLTHWRTLGFAMYILAALGIMLVPLIDPTVEFRPGWVLYGAAAVCAAASLTFLVIPMDRLATVGRVILMFGLLAITGLIATSNPVTWFAIFYLWPLLAAAYVYTRYEFLALNLLTIALHAGALWFQTQTFGTTYPLLELLMWVLGMSTVMVAVRLLREGIDVLMLRLQVISATDALTGLANRRTFEQEFATASQHATRSGEALSVLLFDLDHFKQINDNHGHKEGDNVLQRFAGLLANTCRGDDLPARIGGEEFALIMHGTAANEASVFAERFAEVLRRSNTELAEGEPPVTVSIGVAELSARIQCSETLFVEADRALYEAKRTGRDRVVVARDDAIAPVGAQPA